MPPFDAVGCPTMKFQYGKDCLCENTVACRGLTAAFSLLGNDPRSGFVRLPNYKANPTSQYYIERNLQREAYLRYLLPDHAVEKETLAKDVALHHFHPRVVARLVSNLQKNIPRTISERELKQLRLKVDMRDRILDEEGKPTGRCIFAPSYPIEQSKEDLKRLLRLCRALNAAKQKATNEVKPSSPKPKKRKKRKFDPDIRNEGDLLVNDRAGSDERDERTMNPPSDEEAIVDSLAEHNIQSLLATIIRLEPIPEDLDETGTIMDEVLSRENEPSTAEDVRTSEEELPPNEELPHGKELSAVEDRNQEDVPTTEEELSREKELTTVEDETQEDVPNTDSTTLEEDPAQEQKDPAQEEKDLPQEEEPAVEKKPTQIEVQGNLNVHTLPTLDTDLESDSSADEAAQSLTHNTATVSMQIHLEKLHTGKGKNRMSKVMKKAPSPFFEISVLHYQQDLTADRCVYRRNFLSCE